MDIICINYRSYYLLELQVKHWNEYMRGDFRLLLFDNTPKAERQPFPGIIPIDIPIDHSFDGWSSGAAYDFAIQHTESKIIGMVDPDMFWLNPDLTFNVEFLMETGGYKAVGCQGFYRDWCEIIDKEYPDFAGWKAPVLWGQFLNRELALKDTFICDPPGRGKITGWRTRQRIIDEKIPNLVIPGFYDENGETMFGFVEERAVGVHFLKGCSSRAALMPQIVPPVLEREKAKWI